MRDFAHSDISADDMLSPYQDFVRDLMESTEEIDSQSEVTRTSTCVKSQSQQYKCFACNDNFLELYFKFTVASVKVMLGRETAFEVSS